MTTFRKKKIKSKEPKDNITEKIPKEITNHNKNTSVSNFNPPPPKNKIKKIEKVSKKIIPSQKGLIKNKQKSQNRPIPKHVFEKKESSNAKFPDDMGGSKIKNVLPNKPISEDMNLASKQKMFPPPTTYGKFPGKKRSENKPLRGKEDKKKNNMKIKKPPPSITEKIPTSQVKSKKPK
jgi:hypothetical protein